MKRGSRSRKVREKRESSFPGAARSTIGDRKEGTLNGNVTVGVIAILAVVAIIAIVHGVRLEGRAGPFYVTVLPENNSK